MFSFLPPLNVSALLLAAIVWLGAASLGASSELQFIEVEVPAGHEKVWPAFGHSFGLPMRQEEFQRLIRSAQGDINERDVPASGARITQISLSGQFTDDSLTGSGRIEISYDGEEPSLLNFDAAHIAFSNVVWEDETRASLGTNSKDEVVLYVDKAGVLTFDWSAKATRDKSGIVRLSLRLPSALRASLNVQVPSEYSLNVSNGVVDSTKKLSDNTDEYSIEFGGRSSNVITLVPAVVIDSPSGMAIAAETSQYDLDPLGLELTTSFDIATFGKPFTSPVIEFAIAPVIQPVRVRFDGKESKWNLSENGDRIRVYLQQPLAAQTSTTLEIVAVGPIDLNESVTLPVIRPLNVIWQGADVAIQVDNRLDVRRIVGRTSNDVVFNDARKVREGWFASLRLAEVTSRIELEVGKRTPRVSSDRVLALDVAEEQIQGRASLILAPQSAPLFEIGVVVSANWGVGEDDVSLFELDGDGQTEIPYSVRRINVGEGSNEMMLQLVLDQPIATGQKVRLQVSGRHSGPPPSDLFPLHALDFVRVERAITTTNMVMLASQSPIEARIGNASELRFVGVDAVPEGHNRNWLTANGTGIIAQAADGFRNAMVRIRRSAPDVEAEIDSRIEIRRDVTSHRHRILCEPNAHGLKTLQLVIHPSRSGRLSWSFDDALSAKQVSIERVETPNSPDSETWELRFAERQYSLFEVQATGKDRTTLDSVYDVPLVSVVGAVAQRARVELLGEPLLNLGVSATNTQSLPIPSVDIGASSDLIVLGVYQYQPSSPTPSGSDVSLNVRANKDQDSQSFAWKMTLGSQISNGTRQNNQATWLVDNSTRQEVRVTLPNHCEFESATVNGRSVAIDTARDNCLIVPLEDAGRLPVVVIEFSEKTDRFLCWGIRKPSIPEIDIPVLAHEWRVELPDGIGMIGREVRLHSRQIQGRGRFRKQSDEIATDWHLRQIEKRLLSSGSTWGAALLDSQLESNNQPHPDRSVLLVDSHGLAKIGITADSAVQSDPGHLNALSDVLQSNMAAIVFSPSRVLVTDAGFVARNRNNLYPTEHKCVWQVSGESFERFLEDTNRTEGRFLTPQVWASTLIDPLGIATHVGSIGTDRVNDTNIILDLESNSETKLVIYQETSLQAFALAIAIGAAGAIGIFSRASLRLVLGGLLLLLGVSLLVTSTWVGVVLMISGGVALGGIIALVRRKRTFDSTRRATAPIVLIFCSAVATPTVHADDNETIYPVWVQVDGDGKKTGWVYLPNKFEQLLTSRSEKERLSSGAWFIEHTEYELTFRSGLSVGAIDVDSLTMIFDVNVIEDVDAVQLPIARREISFEDEWASLNGEPVDPNWLEDVSRLSIPVDRIGKHKIELHVRPNTSLSGETAGISVTIPRNPTAQLTIHASADSPTLNINKCLGAVRQIEQDNSVVRSLSADLGAVDAISVDWVRNQEDLGNSLEFSTEELIWLNINESGVECNVKIRAKEFSAEDDEIVVEVDDRFELVSDEASPTASGDSSLSYFRVPVEKIDDGVEARFKLRMTDVANPGLFVLPQIRPLGAVRRQKSIAIGNISRFHVSEYLGLSPMSIEGFLKRWGEADSKPNIALSRVFKKDAAIIQLQPLDEKAVIEEIHDCGLSLDGSRIVYHATITNPNPLVHELRWRLPQDIEIEQVELSGRDEMDASNNAVSWGTDGQELQLIVPSGPETTYTVSISANAATPKPGIVRIPLLRAVNGQVSSSLVNVYRDQHSRVSITRSNGFTMEKDVTQEFGELGRLAVRLKQESPLARNRSCVVKLSQNKLAAQGVQCVRFSGSESSWHTHVDFKVDVRAGVLDELTFEVPTAFAKQMVVSPRVRFRLEPTERADTSLLRIQPNRQIEDAFTVHLASTHATSPGDEVTLPLIRPVFGFPTQRFIALNNNVDGRKVTWDVDGVLLPEVPVQLEQWKDSFDQSDLYHVIADAQRVKLSSQTDVVGVPLVRLADTHFLYRESGQCVGLTRLDLSPGGRSSCVLLIPDDMQLRRVTIDGSPCEATLLTGGRWRLKLASKTLPQRIDVTYAMQPSTNRAAIASAPSIADVAVERTLWTVHSADFDMSALPGENVSATQQEMIRLRSLSSTVRLPPYIRSEFASEEILTWLRPWQRRWQDHRNHISKNQLIHAEIGGPRIDPDQLSALDNRFQQSIDELDLRQSVETKDTDISSTEAMLTLHWRDLVADAPVIARRVVRGSSRNIQLTRTESFGKTFPWSKALLALVAFGAAIAVALIPARFTKSDWVLRCGAAVVVLVALLAAPYASALIVIAAGCTAAAMIGVWLRRSLNVDPFASAMVVRERAGRDG